MKTAFTLTIETAKDRNAQFDSLQAEVRCAVRFITKAAFGFQADSVDRESMTVRATFWNLNTIKTEALAGTLATLGYIPA